MSTTTLRIEESLRERIARLANGLNQTPHSFMVEALAQKVDEAEWRLGVQREAQQRDAALQAGEPGVEWHEMKTYLRSRIAAAGSKTTGRAASKAKRT
jgi:predicted transcriptional regulator